jgi:parvulin-like peptidyl-prolyl isomerase
MAKKRQTTGIPKDPKRTTAERAAVKHRSRHEREQQIQRYVLIGTGVAVLLVVIVLGVALFFDQIINPSRTVATVNGHDISVSDYQKRVRLERIISIEIINSGINQVMDFGFTSDPNEAFNQLRQFDPQIDRRYNELNISDQIGLRVLNDMIDDQLIRDAAEELGITVTEEDIQAEIDAMLGFMRDDVMELAAETTPEPTETPTPTPTPFITTTPSPTPTITPTPETEPTATVTPVPTAVPIPTLTADQQLENFEDRVDALFEQIRDEAGMTDEEINKYFEIQALRTAISEQALGVEEMAPFVNARHILVDAADADLAQDILDDLNAGASFAALASDLSIDEQSAQQGGELEGAPVTNFVEPFADAVRDAPIGEIVGPVESEFGLHIIQVEAREDRELTETQLDTARARAFEEWLTELRQSEDADFETNSIWIDFVPSDPAFFFVRR